NPPSRVDALRINLRLCREIIDYPPCCVDGFGATLCEHLETGQERLLFAQPPFALGVLVEAHEHKPRLIERSCDLLQKILILADAMQEDDCRELPVPTFHRYRNQCGYLLALVSVEGEFRDGVASFRGFLI